MLTVGYKQCSPSKVTPAQDEHTYSSSDKERVDYCGKYKYVGPHKVDSDGEFHLLHYQTTFVYKMSFTFSNVKPFSNSRKTIV